MLNRFALALAVTGALFPMAASAANGVVLKNVGIGASGVRCNDRNTRSCEYLIFEAEDGAKGPDKSAYDDFASMFTGGPLGEFMRSTPEGAAAYDKFGQELDAAKRHDLGARAIGTRKLVLVYAYRSATEVDAELHEISASGSPYYLVEARDGAGHRLPVSASCNMQQVYSDAGTGEISVDPIPSRCHSVVALGTINLAKLLPRALLNVTLTRRSANDCCLTEDWALKTDGYRKLAAAFGH